MSDHLPECPVKNIDIAGLCMCHELRRCEQRMREGWYEVQSETWEQGFRYALNAAREAVVASWKGWCDDPTTCTDYEHVCGERRNTLAAIDALRGES